MKKISDLGRHVEFVPGGYTPKLQVMDVGINKPFNDRIRDEYDDWFLNESGFTTLIPKRYHIAKWIHDAWDDIRPTFIANTWRKIGLSAPDYLQIIQQSNDSALIEEDDDASCDASDFLDFRSIGFEEEIDDEVEARNNKIYKDTVSTAEPEDIEDEKYLIAEDDDATTSSDD